MISLTPPRPGSAALLNQNRAGAHHPSQGLNLGSSPSNPGSNITSPQQLPGPAESFVVLSESTLGAARAQEVTNTSQGDVPENSSSSHTTSPVHPPTNSRSPQHQIERLLKLCSLLPSSNASGMEHPLCAECTDILLELMTNQLQDAKSDRDRYAVFERDLNRERTTSGDAYESSDKIREEIDKVG